MRKTVRLTMLSLLFDSSLLAMEEEQTPAAAQVTENRVSKKRSLLPDKNKDKAVESKNKKQKTEGLQPTNLLDLPDEVLVTIAYHLPAQDIFQFRLVNPRFISLSDEAMRLQVQDQTLLFPKLKTPNLTAYQFRHYLPNFLRDYLMLSQGYSAFIKENIKDFFKRHRKLITFCQQNKLKLHSALFKALELKGCLAYRISQKGARLGEERVLNLVHEELQFNIFINKLTLACQSGDLLAHELGLTLSLAFTSLDETFRSSSTKEGYLRKREILSAFTPLTTHFNENTIAQYAKPLIHNDRLFVWQNFCPPQTRLETLMSILKDRDKETPEHREKYYAEALSQAEANKSVENGASQYILGYCYLYGLGVEKDYEKARDFLDPLDFTYDPDYLQGLMCEEGLGQEVDIKQAREHYDVSISEHSNLDATYRLAFLDLKKSPPQTPQEISNVNERLKDAADQGHSESAFVTGEVYRKIGQLRFAIGYYDLAARENHVKAIRRLGTIYGINYKNPAWALEMFKRAAKLGDKKAISQAYDLLDQTASLRDPREKAELRDWMLKAVEVSHAPALLRLGQAYLIGNLGFQVDKEKAYSYLDQAVEEGGIDILMAIIKDSEILEEFRAHQYYNKASEILGLPPLEDGIKVQWEHYTVLHKAYKGYLHSLLQQLINLK